MKKTLFLLTILIFTLSSGFMSNPLSILNPVSSLKSYIIKNSNSSEIKFYVYKEARNDLKKQFTFKTKEDISKIVDFISGKSAPFYKGGYNGSIDFLKDGKSLLEEKMEFNLSQDLKHIVFFYKKKLYSRKLTDNGLKFLQELSNKKAFASPEKLKPVK